MSESINKVSFFKKGKTRPTSTRQRSPPPTSPPDTTSTFKVANESNTGSAVVVPNRKTTSKLLSQGTKRTRRDDEDDDDSARVDVNWAGGSSSNANKVLDILEGDEAEALLARKRAKFDDDEDGDIGPDDGLYHGQAGYKSHITKSKEIPKAMRVGPQRSTGSTIRTVTIVDYQPDVCKDYKETGFCGFGDTCKFLHDRGTYLAGWQLDKLAADSKGNAADDAESDTDSDEDIPFACLICRKPYTDPVVTRCGHYFCSSCAIKRFSKTPKCLACGAPTAGIFNRADKIIAKVNEKRKSKEMAEEEEEESNQGGVEVEGLADAGSEDDD
ncbi:hypothetical protein M422DRAFT_246452 [Sphaerobolus stellatus SS14]|nr:hypothetical protein M422DRAFT_246452 [Sphaerobolus stellatus SS14]